MKQLLTSALFALIIFTYGCGKSTVAPDTADNPSNNNNSNGSGSNTVPTVTSPDTYFIAFQNYTVINKGAFKAEAFTVYTPTTFIFRFAATYNSQAAIVPEAQFTNFKMMVAFTGFGIFDNQVGTKTVTLNPGNYYVGVRNTTDGRNEWSVELDKAITLPTTDKATFTDTYLSGAKSFSAGGKLWQPFSIQHGYRYFLDGASVGGLVMNIIPEVELANFQSGGSFKYYPNYYGSTGGDPGLYEIKLDVGNYYLVASSANASAITYSIERWKVNN